MNDDEWKDWIMLGAHVFEPDALRRAKPSDPMTHEETKPIHFGTPSCAEERTSEAVWEMKRKEEMQVN